MRRPRRNHTASFKAKVAVAALKDDKMLAEYLERTHRFYERHGGKTVMIVRSLPIFRTFVPFVAGVGRREYSRFLFYSFSGSVFWIGFFVFGGYYFGNIPFVKQNLTLFIIGIIVLSVMPGVIEFVRQKSRTEKP